MQSLAYTYLDIAKMIDHSLLNPALTLADLEDGCRLAVAFDVASVCIMPYAVARCKELLAGSNVKVSTTVGFPHGVHATAIKVAEARQAIVDGAVELDVVVNISKAVSGDWDYVSADLGAVIEAVHGESARVKVIFENCYLSDQQKIHLCRIASDLRADWVKTSTGFGSEGATLADIALMRKHSAPEVQIKAAGGVRDLDVLLQMRALGVTRCGATRTMSILGDCRSRLGLPLITGISGAIGAGY